LCVPDLEILRSNEILDDLWQMCSEKRSKFYGSKNLPEKEQKPDHSKDDLLVCEVLALHCYTGSGKAAREYHNTVNQGVVIHHQKLKESTLLRTQKGDNCSYKIFSFCLNSAVFKLSNLDSTFLEVESLFQGLSNMDSEQVLEGCSHFFSTSREHHVAEHEFASPNGIILQFELPRLFLLHAIKC